MDILRLRAVGLSIGVGLTILGFASRVFAAEGSVSCDEAFGDKKAECARIACPKTLKDYLGTWDGTFESFDREVNQYRKLRSRLEFTENDCFKNLQSGDVFLLGRRVEEYDAAGGMPTRKSQSVWAIGLRKGESASPFLRTVDEDYGAIDYERVSASEESKGFWVWRGSVACGYAEPGAEVVFTLREERLEGPSRRSLVTHIRIGPETHPHWEGVLSRGIQELRTTNSN